MLARVDPFSLGAGAAAGKAIAGSAASKAADAVVSHAIETLKGDELDRVLRAVDAELLPEVGTAGLAFLREDQRIVAMILELLTDRTTWDEGAMVAAIEPHVGPVDEETTAHDFAVSLARSIKRNVFQAESSHTTAVVREVQGISDQLDVLSARLQPERRVAEARAPGQALDTIRELEQAHPDEARQLSGALTDERTRVGQLRGLINDPPPWISNGSSDLWRALADLAMSYGQMEEAEKAALTAADRPGADRVRAWAYAADIAWMRGDRDQADAVRSTSSLKRTVRNSFSSTSTGACAL
jgi:hypothetical protein